MIRQTQGCFIDSVVVDHSHLYCGSPKLNLYYHDFHKTLSEVFKKLYLGQILFLGLRSDAKLLEVILSARRN